MFAASVSQYRTMSFSYIEPVAPVPVRAAGVLADAVLLRLRPGAAVRVAIRLHRSRPRAGDADLPRRDWLRHLPAESLRAPRDVRRHSAVQSGVQRARVCRSWPTNSRRSSTAGRLFNSGTVHAARHHLRPGDDGLPRVRSARRQHHPCRLRVRPARGDLLSRQTVDVDARYYMRLGTNGVLAFRARGYKSWGEFPGYLYFGGNSEMRGYDYLEFLGNKAFFTNAELRFPLIEAALTPIGVVGGLRGVFFVNFGGAGYEGMPMKVWTSATRRSAAAARVTRSTRSRRPGQRRCSGYPISVRIPAHRQPRLLRRRPRDLRARLPDPLRLVVAHALQQRLRGLRLRVSRPRSTGMRPPAATGSAR